MTRANNPEFEAYYTKHLVLLWNKVCSALGLNGLLGAVKRRMLSFAERPSVDGFGVDVPLPLTWPLAPFVEIAEGILRSVDGWLVLPPISVCKISTDV